MKAIRSFTVIPSLPAKLEFLRILAYNLWWSWNWEAIDLFKRLDYELWETSGHNPVKMLGSINQHRLLEASKDEAFLAHMNRVKERFERYLKCPIGTIQTHLEPIHTLIAYFSFEYGLHESIPIYSGGLGVLAGDLIKSASELGFPLVGVGILYRYGNFKQYLNPEGWQQEIFPENDFYNLPVMLIRKNENEPLLIDIELADRKIFSYIWRMYVGRIMLIFLDTNVPQNSTADREITAKLYGGDSEMRIKQEILLGIGGIKALTALGITPTIYHMNEGHSAFLGLERIKMMMEKYNFNFDEAKEAVMASNVFTTHTPVKAGIDLFSPELMEKYFSNYYKKLSISWDEFIGLGRVNPKNKDEPFCMPVLAMKLAKHINGVSKLHAKISRKMWQGLWPEIPENEIPIISITNGVHIRFWLSSEMASLYDRYLGPQWVDKPMDQNVWKRATSIPDSELWRAHERMREQLVAYARRLLVKQLKKRGASLSEIEMAKEVLDPTALTIGFGRRFAEYKRGYLIMKNPDRLKKIINNPEKPVQIIFAGKAHQKDNQGKEIIRQIVQIARHEELRKKIVFLEDYDIALAQYMVQGVDIWLNTPRRPLEASGTSGMKVVANGGINMSVLDGWWCEGYKGENGWAIGAGEIYEDYEYQDEVESRAIYDLLEKEIVPLFYKRGTDGLPREWIAIMKNSITTLCPYFNTNRMIEEYGELFYVPGTINFFKLMQDDKKKIHEIASWKRKIRENWNQIEIKEVTPCSQNVLKVGDQFVVEAKIILGNLTPNDVLVELYYGKMDSQGNIKNSKRAIMKQIKEIEKGIYLYKGSTRCRESGHQGYAIRILPFHEYLSSSFEMGLIKWG